MFLRRNVIKEMELVRSFYPLNVIVDDNFGCFKEEYERRTDVPKVEQNVDNLLLRK